MTDDRNNKEPEKEDGFIVSEREQILFVYRNTSPQKSLQWLEQMLELLGTRDNIELRRKMTGER